jgi:Lrp/AsnC family transcriptional regulator, leucine-responsive regulatory protein
MAILDATNLAMLTHLQRDGRCTVADLARRIGKSEATVRDRLANLEQRGVLRGYQARVDLGRIGIDVAAHIGVELDYEDLPRLRHELAAVPQVVSAQVVTGDLGLRLGVVARDLVHLERVLQKRLRPLGLERFHTEIVVEEILPARPPDLSGVLGKGARRPSDQGPVENGGASNGDPGVRLLVR